MPRWVTVFGQVNQLGTESGTQAYSAWACPLCMNEYLAKAGEVNRHIAWHTSPCAWSRSVRWMPGWWLASGDQRQLTGSGSVSETCSWWWAIQMAAFIISFILHPSLSVQGRRQSAVSTQFAVILSNHWKRPWPWKATVSKHTAASVIRQVALLSPCDASSLSVVRFNSWPQSSVISYFGFRFTNANN